MDGLAAPLRTARLPRLTAPGLRRLLVLTVLLCVLGAGWLWLRDSSLVRVREVFVTGVTSSQEAKVREALRSAAMDMTTLNVREEQLRTAVAPYASVADLEVDAAFPHKLSIEVVERRPAAIAVAAGERVPVSADGLLLRGVRAEGDLPVVAVRSLPAGGRIRDRAPSAAVAILGAAPAELLARVERSGSGPDGLKLDLRDGPDLIFGSATRVRAKWAAAARVLADSSAAGATYLDLRVPERTAAGGVGPIEPDATAVPAPGAPGATQETAPGTPQP